jgi:nicotinamidase/pyrazinamidase
MTVGFLVVDPQNDFFPGGALAVARGDEILAPVNALLARYPLAPVFASRDWHPTETRHFAKRGGPWPPHCVQHTRGAAFHDELLLPAHTLVYEKGTHPEDDGGYSAFDGMRGTGSEQRALVDDLHAAGVTALLVVGLATDYCVKASVLDAVKHRFAVFAYEPGMRAVDVQPGDGAKALHAMRDAGAFLVESGGFLPLAQNS